MCSYYAAMQEKGDKEGPGTGGEWIDLSVAIDGFELDPESMEMDIAPPPPRKVKIEKDADKK